jgi:hypothetical protein
MVLLESVGENVLETFPGTQLQAQEAFMNILKKDRSDGSLWCAY